MAFVLADRVRETTTTAGTGAVSLGGAVSGFQSFSTAIGDANNTYYTIADSNTGAWEVGIGTYTSSGNTLSRDTVLSSSNSGNLVSFAANVKDVFVTQPASRAVFVQNAGTGLQTGTTAFTANRVIYSDATTTTATSANMTFDGTRLTVADFADSGLTSTRVVYSTTGGNLIDSANLTFNGTTLTSGGYSTGGNLAFTGTGNRITGDFSNATVANRVMFQTSTTNGNTYIGAVPNGTGTEVGTECGNYPWVEKVNGITARKVLTTGAQELPYGASGAGVIRLNGTNYQSQGTTSSPETRAFIHTYRPLGTAQGGTAAFSTDGANSFVGAGAGNFTMAPDNAAVGTYDIQCSYNAGFGTQALGSLTTGYNNVGIGVNAMRYTTQGFGNSSVGRDSMHEQTTGNNNSAFGRSSLYDITTGAYNTAIGSTTGHGITTGNNNTIVGARVTGLSSSLSGAVIVAAGDGTPYVDIQPSGGNDSLIDVPSANTTAYNGSATDGQIGAGATLLLRSNVSSANFVSQVVFLARAGQPYNRIVSSGSTTPFMAFCTNNAERARIDSSGNVGIGTSSPTQELHLYKDQNATTEILIENPNAGTSGRAQLELSPELGSAYFTANSSTSTVSAIAGGALGAGLYTTSALSNGLSVGTTAGALKFFAGSTSAERARIDSSGNLGLGVTPSAWASNFKANQIGQGAYIAGRTDAVALYMGSNGFWNGSSDRYIANGFATDYYQATGQHIWRTAASGTAGNAITFTQAMTLTAAGDLGVGATSPAARLDLGTPGNVRFINAENGVDANFRATFSSNTVTFANTGGSGVLAFQTGGSERARIDSSGNLLVGKTTSSLSTSGFVASNTGFSATNSGAEAANFNRTSSDGTLVIFRRSDTSVGTISVTTTATSYNTSSDYRLKHDIAPMTGALEKVAALKPVTYKWNADNSAGEGFIAHELAEVVPQCVTGEKDAVETYTDEEGNEQTRPKYQGIDTSFLVATLTAAIQELKAELDATKAEVAALKGA